MSTTFTVQNFKSLLGILIQSKYHFVTIADQITLVPYIYSYYTTNNFYVFLGGFLVIISCILVSTHAKYLPMEFAIDSPDYERILRSDSGFSRILRSLDEEDGGDEQQIEEEILNPDPKRSFEPASFSR